MLENIRKFHILLGSKSPRRRELLHMLRIPFTVVNITGVDESYPENMESHEIPLFLSGIKADAYIKHLHENEMIITADTLVILDDKILGKPKTYEGAIEMLKMLSGKTHQVVTGVTIATLDKRTQFSTTSSVKFAELTEEEIKYYVDNFRPFDKAGAYGIQEWIGGVAVEKIDGSFYNVMGLPVHRLFKELNVF